MQPGAAFVSPSDRLIRSGIAGLSAEELIALVMQRGRQGQDGLEAARKLASEFGSVGRLARAQPEELTTLTSITPDEAAALVSAFRLARLADEDSSPPSLKSAADIAAVAGREIGDATRERAVVLICDSANQLRRITRVSEGGIDRAFLPVREILNAVLRHDGRAFAVAHNHPSGDPTPSAEDLRATREIDSAARTVGLRFLDHVIVAGNQWTTISSERRKSG